LIIRAQFTGILRFIENGWLRFFKVRKRTLYDNVGLKLRPWFFRC